MTDIGRDTDHLATADAGAVLTGIADRAGISIAATGAIGFHRIGTLSRRRVAGSSRVTLIGGKAGFRVAPDADPSLTRVRLGTGIPVVARRSVGFGRIATLSGRGIADPGRVTLVARGTGYRRTSRTDSRLAGVVDGAEVAIVATAAIGFRGIRALSVRRIAGPNIVTLVRGGADNRVAADTDTGLAGIGLSAGIAVVAGGPVRLDRI